MNLYVVTGTTRGLGEALARLIARDPANELIAIARAADADIPGGVLVGADLADPRAVEAACARIAARVRGKRYDKAVLVNNAGVVQPVAPLERVDARELERNLAVNLLAPMLLMRGFLEATAEGARLRRI
ncbi:MAG TPA: SDR family NAD(P)-dependent oxidoreductase, partial [Usitatibacter sp.]|nr:SDR family NAD(P)-dependent oxidoreductase [Usitatibacter sp.]